MMTYGYNLRGDTIVGYTFQAETLCPDCTVTRVMGEEFLEFAGHEMALNFCAEQIGLDRQDESTFDSGDFPKVIFATDLDDEPCDNCSKMLIGDR